MGATIEEATEAQCNEQFYCSSTVSHRYSPHCGYNTNALICSSPREDRDVFNYAVGPIFSHRWSDCHDGGGDDHLCWTFMTKEDCVNEKINMAGENTNDCNVHSYKDIQSWFYYGQMVFAMITLIGTCGYGFVGCCHAIQPEGDGLSSGQVHAVNNTTSPPIATVTVDATCTPAPANAVPVAVAATATPVPAAQAFAT